MADLTLKVGQTVQAQDGRHGTIRYIGPLHIAAGEWLGLELPESNGKNDGSVKGERYFQCRPGYGIFVRKESITRIVKQPTAAVAKPNGSVPTVNGSASHSSSRTSGVVSADVARKRQSLMGSGPGSAPGSRLSIRSPTKSPVKPGHSSASSAASTPRTGTPATTARTSDSSSKSRLSVNSRNSMPPPPPPSTSTKSLGHPSRASVGGVVNKFSTKPTVTSNRQSIGGTSRLSLQPKTVPNKEKNDARPIEAEAVVKSPTIDEDDEDGANDVPEHFEDATVSDATIKQPPYDEDTSIQPEPSDDYAMSRSNPLNSVESRTAQKKELEQYKATIRTLEKKLLDNREKLKGIDALQGENGRYEGIIQALQKKLKANQQEMSDLRSKCEEIEARANQGSDRSAEHESQIELATLDKEMAEERADMYQAELDALKSRHEEMELEVEILREENRELVSVMSPEEKANAGWLQMEREQERLRQALILLRDVSQQNEADLKVEIRDLQETLDETEKTASKYEETAEKLARFEQTNKHLMEQLEAVETNDEVVEAMEIQREQSLNVIEQLRKQIQDLEEHIQVTDELESFHVEEEKRLHYQLDESEAIINEKHKQTNEQQRVVEDLEYTLSKFRDVVQGLQSDIDELRKSRDISEHEAHEMSSKSRAMLDLNLQLQNSAVKTQLKAIDVEMGKMQADQAILHLEILQNFVPDSMDSEKHPILALLCFKRIKARASLTRSLLGERMRDRPQLAQDDPFTVFEVMEKMHLIASYCERFETFMLSCSTNEFARFSGALYELEPVERAVTGWIEALRRDDLGSDGPEHLQRMISILTDMTEKLIPENAETKATEMFTQSVSIAAFADSIALQLSAMTKEVQSRLGQSKEDDDESIVFEKKLDQFCMKARTVKYLCGKVTQVLKNLRSRSMCMGEISWGFIETAVQNTEQLSNLVRGIGMAVFEEMTKIERNELLSYSVITSVMNQATQKIIKDSGPKVQHSEDVFLALGELLQTLQTKVDDLNNMTSDLSSAIEFEKQPAPWVIRAKEIKAQKVISPDVVEELARLNSQAQEQGFRIGERDKQLEEQQIKIELLESRAKETKMKDDGVKAMKEEMERLLREKDTATDQLDKLRHEYEELRQNQALQQPDKDLLNTGNLQNGVNSTMGVVDETVTLHLKAEIELLYGEISNLQSIVRHLKSENKSLRIPPNEVVLSTLQHNWLDSKSLIRPHRDNDNNNLTKESKDIFTGLIEIVKTTKPVILKPKSISDHNVKVLTSWKPQKHTTRYQVLQQKEEFEKWNDWKNDLIKRAKLINREMKIRKKSTSNSINPVVYGIENMTAPHELSSVSTKRYDEKLKGDMSNPTNIVQIV